MGINWYVDNKTGIDCSGSDGDLNRVLTLSNTELTAQYAFGVYVSGLTLTLNTDYTVSHLASGTQVTFLNPLWNDMTVIVAFSQGSLNSYDYYTTIGAGANCDGSSGDSNRVWIMPNTRRTLQQGFLVFASNLCLAYGSEYTAVQKTSGTEITFLNPLWNDMPIEVKYLQFNGLVALSDNLKLTDLNLKETNKSLQDTLKLNDTFSRIIVLTRTLSDNLKLSDNYSRTLDLFRIYSDNLKLTDNYDRLWNSVKTFSDSLILSDGSKFNPERTLTETLKLSDNYSRIWTLNRIYLDNLKLNDGDITNFFTKFLLENLKLSDNYSRIFTLSRTYSDNLILSDDELNDIKIFLEDNLKLNDIFSSIRGKYSSLQEYLVLNDDYIRLTLSKNLMLLASKSVGDMLLAKGSVGEILMIKSG